MTGLEKASGAKQSQITLTRELKVLIESGQVLRDGKGRAIRYSLSPTANLLRSIDVDKYFERSPDERPCFERYNLDILDQLGQISVFDDKELKLLSAYHKEFQAQKKALSPTLVKKEFERFTIELSWKSSVIEGNTYSLLETETLLKEGIAAKGKKAEDARMLLNHKTALGFVQEHAADFFPLNLRYIEKTHSLLVKGLGVSDRLRKTLVSITGTRYRPLDNEFQVREALEGACRHINRQKDCFSRSLLAILLISYIQPFEDGNKRTSRIIGNALLLNKNSFPLSFRSVDATDYKKAILLFYERNNITAFKEIFIEQAEFSVKNYYRSTASNINERKK